MREGRGSGGMEYEAGTSCKVNRTEQGTSQQNDGLIPGLPDEISMLCIVRVPRSYHRIVSSVCRSWRSVVHGRVFLKLRRDLSLAEDWIYLWTVSDNAWRCFDPSVQKWWKLPVMPPDNRFPGSSAFASLDGKLFVIGGGLLNIHNNTGKRYIPSRTVSYFDAGDYCWKRAADLNIGRAHCMTGVINNQLYVCGGEIEGNFDVRRGRGMSRRTITTTTAEMYDPITDTWKFISSMKNRMKMRDCVAMEGKFYAKALGSLDEELRGVVYDTETDKWERMAHGLIADWGVKTAALNGKLYTVDNVYVADNLEYEDRAGDLDSEDGEPEADQMTDDEPEVDQIVEVYNPSKDAWEMVVQSWVVLDLSFGSKMSDVELISFDGKLCVISVQTYAGTTEIRMVILEVQDSTETPTCFVVFKRNFKIELLDEPRPMLWGIRRCQVIAL